MLNQTKSWGMRSIAVIAIAGAVTAGCESEEPADTETYGNGEGSGGAGGSGTGGAGGGGDMPARAAFSVSFVDPGAKCAIASHIMTVGEVDAQMANLLLADGAIIDGDTTSIQCSVIDTGKGSFAVSANVSSQGRTLSIDVATISQSHVAGNPASGFASYASEKTVDIYSGSCEFTVLQQTLAPGKAWMEFTCPEVSEDMSTCRISTAYVIVQGCAAQ